MNEMQTSFLSILFYLLYKINSSFIEVSSSQNPIAVKLNSSSSFLLSYSNTDKSLKITQITLKDKDYEISPYKTIENFSYYSYEANFAKVGQTFIFFYDSPLKIAFFNNEFEIINEIESNIETSKKAYSISDIMTVDNDVAMIMMINYNGVYILFIDMSNKCIKNTIFINLQVIALGGFCGQFTNREHFKGACVIPYIDESRIIFVKDNDYKMVNINNKSFINRDFNNVAKGDVLTDQLIISCFYNYFGKIKCGLLTFDQEDLGTKAELFNEETIFEKCDNVYSRTFDFAKISSEKYAISCTNEDDILIKIIYTNGNDKLLTSEKISFNTQEIAQVGELSFLSLLPIGNEVNFLFSIEDSIYFNHDISLPNCINGNLEYFFTDEEIENGKSQYTIHFFFYHLTTNDEEELPSHYQLSIISIINNPQGTISQKVENNSGIALPQNNISPDQTFPLDTNFDYVLLSENINYNISVSMTFYISTINHLMSDKCVLDFKINFNCYKSCSSCVRRGNSNNHYCTSCKHGYYPKLGAEYNCYLRNEKLAHYFFSDVKLKYLPCSEACLTCYSSQLGTDTNCYSCNVGYVSHPKDASTCVRECDKEISYWYLDNNEYKCTNELACPYNFPIYNEETNKCSDACEDPLKPYLYNKTDCVSKCPDNTYIDETNKKCFDIPPKITISQIDDLILALPEQEILFTQNGTVYVYESSEEGFNAAKDLAIENNLSYIDFEECINVLKNVWNIDKDQNLVIALVELNRTTQITNKLEYMIYKQNGQKLDLSVCSNLNIRINYYITDVSNISLDLAKELEEKGVDIYNGKDDFFNNYCLNFTSKYNTDVILKDRRLYYFKNVSYCELNCSYLHINIDEHRVECACPVKDAPYNEEDEEEEENENPPDFSSEITSSNYEVIVCYNQVFNSEKLKVNLGHYIFLGMGAVIIGIFIQYGISGKKSIMKFIIENNVNGENFFSRKQKNNNNNTKVKIKFPKSLGPPPRKRIPKSYQKNNNYIYESNNKKNITNNNTNHNKSEIEESTLDLAGKKEKSNDRPDQTIPCNIPKNSIKPSIITIHHNEFIQNRSILNSISLSNTKACITTGYISTLENLNRLPTEGSTNQITTVSSKKTTTDFLIGPNARTKKKLSSSISEKKIQKKKKVTSLDYEEMTFETAILIDHRPLFQLYKELIISKHIFFCLIWNKGILLKQIKFSVFLVGTATDFFFNAFFYSDEYIEQSFHAEGELEYLVTLPKSIFSFLATAFFTYFLEYLTSSKFLVMLVRSEFKEKFYSQCNSFINMLQCKIKAYIVISILIMFFFWYYVSAFCAVYQNSQISWLSSTFLSFGLSILTPFITIFCAAFSRVIGLRKKSKFWYKISSIILFLV